MSLPKQLITSFEKIKSSLLVSGQFTKENVQFFVDALNDAIPSSSNPIAYTLYRFNRTKYIADKDRFVNDIKGFESYEAMVLWLDFADILKFFNLEGKIFLGWDKKNNRYRGFLTTEKTSEEVKEVKILRRGETIQTIHEQHFVVEPEAIKIQREVDDDMDKIYMHMQDRLMAVTKMINGVE